MTPAQGTFFRIYIIDGDTRFYLRDWIASDKRDNLLFDVDPRYAMRFKKLAVAENYRKRMVALNYHPQIERV